MHLDLNYGAYCCVGLSVLFSVLAATFFSRLAPSSMWWQYCIPPLTALLTQMMPSAWYLICKGLIRAARRLGDEIEQVWITD
jgi:hypothetical protein